MVCYSVLEKEILSGSRHKNLIPFEHGMLQQERAGVPRTCLGLGFLLSSSVSVTFLKWSLLEFPYVGSCCSPP